MRRVRPQSLKPAVEGRTCSLRHLPQPPPLACLLLEATKVLPHSPTPGHPAWSRRLKTEVRDGQEGQGQGRGSCADRGFSLSGSSENPQTSRVCSAPSPSNPHSLPSSWSCGASAPSRTVRGHSDSHPPGSYSSSGSHAERWGRSQKPSLQAPSSGERGADSCQDSWPRLHLYPGTCQRDHQARPSWAERAPAPS
ncbi:hypothetical protein HJG60_012000 [Phyllostomus discolor]|uniref:Uncharacterized protein n=1 Tax=Phyllostomus discolor TaxID=89673 RepID=A0A833ZLZ0_9CHIR|nr:hypothetical protein HJG60_012000 [Phyllostomus discolor]